MNIYTLEWPSSDVKGAVRIGFTYMETMDEIVGFLCGRPEIIQKIILELPDEFKADFIPQGVGRLRTAYVLYKSIRWNELRFISREKTVELQIKLI